MSDCRDLLDPHALRPSPNGIIIMLAEVRGTTSRQSSPGTTRLVDTVQPSNTARPRSPRGRESPPTQSEGQQRQLQGQHPAQRTIRRLSGEALGCAGGLYLTALTTWPTPLNDLLRRESSAEVSPVPLDGRRRRVRPSLFPNYRPPRFRPRSPEAASRRASDPAPSRAIRPVRQRPRACAGSSGGATARAGRRASGVSPRG